MRKNIFCLICILLIVLVGCKTNVETEKSIAKKDTVVVTMPVTSEPEYGFNPVYGWGAGEHTHEPLIQSTLFITTNDLKIDYDLATDYFVSEDGMTWTVTIREDAYFTDGEKLTAEDVAFTYNTCKQNSSVNDFTMLDYAEAIDEKTVVFHMTRPFSVWSYTMTLVGIVPEHAYTSDYGENPVGSGKYILKQWDKGQQVILEANANYYGNAPKIKTVIVLFMEEEISLAAAQSGQSDVSYTSATYADISVADYELYSVTSLDNRGINLPTQPAEQKDGIVYGNDVTSDITIRRAINIALNRKSMISNVLNGYASPAYSICDNTPWYQKDSEVQYNLEQANTILDDAGWTVGDDGIRNKNGIRAAFSILYPPSDSIRQGIAEEFCNNMKQIGLEVTPECVGWDIAYDLAQSQPLVWGWGAHTPMELYNIYHSQNGEYARYSPYYNEVVDNYMDEALKSTDIEMAYTLWQKAQWNGTTGITQKGDIPWIWICNVDHLYFVKQGLIISEQKIHPHGHGWSLLNNVDTWEWQ